MGEEAEADERRRVFAPYQVNAALMAAASARRALHALPARPSRRGGDRRGDRVRGLGGVRSGREPAAHAEGPAAMLLARRIGSSGSRWHALRLASHRSACRMTSPMQPLAGTLRCRTSGRRWRRTRTRRSSTISTSWRREHGDEAGAALQGHVDVLRDARSESTRSPRRSWRSASARRSRRARSSPTARSSSSRSSAPGRRAPSSSPLNPTYSEREIEQALDATRAEMVVTLTPFYERVKQRPGPHAGGRVIATSIKEYCRRCCACCSPCSRRRRTAIASRSPPGTSGCGALLQRHAARPARLRPSAPTTAR